MSVCTTKPCSENYSSLSHHAQDQNVYFVLYALVTIHNWTCLNMQVWWTACMDSVWEWKLHNNGLSRNHWNLTYCCTVPFSDIHFGNKKYTWRGGIGGSQQQFLLWPTCTCFDLQCSCVYKCTDVDLLQKLKLMLADLGGEEGLLPQCHAPPKHSFHPEGMSEKG